MKLSPVCRPSWPESASNCSDERLWAVRRQVGRTGSLRRELIIPFGATGYVAQYEIEPATSRVIVLAIRHQREEDYL